VTWAAEEFSGTEQGDGRLARRLIKQAANVGRSNQQRGSGRLLARDLHDRQGNRAARQGESGRVEALPFGSAGKIELALAVFLAALKLTTPRLSKHHKHDAFKLVARPRLELAERILHSHWFSGFYKELSSFKNIARKAFLYNGFRQGY